MPIPRRFDRRPPERDTTRINERIRVPEVRLIDEKGEQIGVMKTDQALDYARERDLDLVEIAPEARPPVCRVLDYSKYKYEQEQKKKAARKHQQQVTVREMKLRPKIATHDYETKKGHIVRFLKHGQKVKVTIMFRGREMAHPERGEALLRKVADEVAEFGTIEQHPNQEGRNMTMVMAPVKAPARKPDRPADAAPADGVAAPEEAAAPAEAAPAEATPAEAAPARPLRRGHPGRGHARAGAQSGLAPRRSHCRPAVSRTGSSVCVRRRKTTPIASRRSARTPRSPAGRTCPRRTRSRTRAAGSRWRRSNVSVRRCSTWSLYAKAMTSWFGAGALRLHGEVGYWVAADARGSGIGSRVVELLTQFAFETLSFPYVEIVISPENEASLGVARRCGYTEQRRELREFKGALVEFAIYRRAAGG